MNGEYHYSRVKNAVASFWAGFGKFWAEDRIFFRLGITKSAGELE